MVPKKLELSFFFLFFFKKKKKKKKKKNKKKKKKKKKSWNYLEIDLDVINNVGFIKWKEV